MTLKNKLFITTFGLAVWTASLAGAVRADDAKPNPNADPKAYELLKKAYDARQTLPEDFAGFDADIVYREGEKTTTGTIRYRSALDCKVTAEGLKGEDLKWLQRQARSFVIHRNSGEFDESEGRFPVSFAKSEVTDFGTLIEYNDPQKLDSRVRDNQALEMTRTAGEKRFFISVLENKEYDPGKFTPTRYVVSYFDPQTRVLQAVNIYENSYEKISDLWLPATRRVVTIDHVLGDGLRVRTFEFKNIKLIEKK